MGVLSGPVFHKSCCKSTVTNCSCSDWVSQHEREQLQGGKLPWPWTKAQVAIGDFVSQLCENNSRWKACIWGYAAADKMATRSSQERASCSTALCETGRDSPGSSHSFIVWVETDLQYGLYLPPLPKQPSCWCGCCGSPLWSPPRLLPATEATQSTAISFSLQIYWNLSLYLIYGIKRTTSLL